MGCLETVLLLCQGLYMFPEIRKTRILGSDNLEFFFLWHLYRTAYASAAVHHLSIHFVFSQVDPDIMHHIKNTPGVIARQLVYYRVCGAKLLRNLAVHASCP